MNVTSDSPPPVIVPTRLRLRTAAIMGMILLVVFGTPVGLWHCYDAKWGRELEARLAALQAQGIPLSIADAAPGPVPDDENAAVLYQTVFRVSFLGAAQPAASPIAELSDVVSGATEEGALELAPELRKALSSPEAAELLDTLRQASERPHCVFPVRWEDGAGAVFPHMARFRAATRAVAARAALSAQDGHVDEALDWTMVGLRMSEHAAGEPTLIGQLVSYAMQTIVMGRARDIVSAARVPPAVARRCERQLRRMDVCPSFRAAVRGETAWGLDTYEMLRRDPWHLYDLLGLMGDASGPNPVLARLYYTGLASPLHKLDEFVYLHHMEQVRELSKLPYRESADELAALDKSLGGLHDYMLARIVCPAWSGPTQKRDRGAADIALFRTVLALKSYKHAHGRYPGTLAQLQETLDFAMPTDPFSGKNFAYRTKGDGFALYSLGPDPGEDAGVSDRELQYRAAHAVWECAR
jgi:hypothetical protein